jgi:shikimate dehydrogenase
MMRAVTAQTAIAGVAGQPVRHSLSPVIHNAWIEAAGLDAVYLAFAPGQDSFPAFVQGLRGAILGLNVTLPFKEQALTVADRTSDAARKAGAANLLVFSPDGGVEADNTDGVGLIAALEAGGWRLGAGPAVVLGAGGAARGAASALLEAGVDQVAVVNRTLERAEAIAALDPRISAHRWEDAAGLLGEAGVLINATLLGMGGQPPLELPLEALARQAVVMDMVYRPLKTPLLKAAEAGGHPIANGLDMLIAQARPSFQRIFRQPAVPDLDVKALCVEALER